MDKKIYDLHIKSGQIAGKEKTCGKKNAYENEEAGQKAASAHNRWDKRRHDVEAYPCAFCDKWHIGNIMPVELMEEIINGKNIGSLHLS
jgi:hypothetical protein